MTPVQRKALEWLPADGSWKMDPGRISQALSSFKMNYKDCLEHEVGYFGKRGAWKYRYRLTPLGQELREKVVRGTQNDQTL